MAERQVTKGDILAELTRDMQRLAEQIGLDDVMRLIDARGGTNVYVPHSPEPGSALCDIVSPSAAATLAAMMPGSHLKLPTCRSAQVLWWSTQDISTAELALKFKLDQRSVHRILARRSEPFGVDADGQPIPSPQLDMFRSA